ncbi:uncharacterized protein si:dkey-88l16.3 isoform X2 [Danio rerio]|uniref:Uncharacterized protein si:dkey-88l16.3 isoform X2 n=1 Tax=Danio rerio TaxID=7955 RepID=A0AC58GLH1_DANRE
MDLQRFFCCTAVFVLLSGVDGGCSRNQWQCDDGACVSHRWRCDGASDCQDGSDEMECLCQPGDFECLDGSGCVIGSDVCDGVTHCPDGSDEWDCSWRSGCLSSDWKCRNNICIPQELLCNDANDCGDDSDEETCGSCGRMSIRCPDGSCLTPRQRCDGVAQCSDSRDEPLTCGKSCLVGNGGCSHFCTDKFWGALCSCPAGMTLSANGRDCEDVNECAQSVSPCMHLCSNTPGSYRCQCANGFKPLGNGSCEAQGPVMKILTTRKGLVGLVNVKTRVFEPLFTTETEPVAMTSDIQRNLIYWADGNGGIFKTYNRKSTVLYSGQWGVKSLAVDWLTGQLYWTSVTQKAIYTGAADGSAVGMLMSKGVDPSDLVLSPIEGFMFWMNKGVNGEMTIERVDMDGMNRKTLVFVTAQLPRGLTLDVSARRLYWISVHKMSVESVRTDGTGRHTFWDVFQGSPAQALAVFNGWFYWADDKRLWQAPQNQPAAKQNGFIIKASLPSLTVYHPLQQPQGFSACKGSGCQLCLPTKNSDTGFTCLCPEGALPMPYGSCENFKVAYATSMAIYSLEFTGRTPVKTELFTSNEDIQSFDMFWQQGLVIWSNGTGHVKTNMPSEDLSEYILTLKPACIIRVDQRNGNLYWLACDELSIGVSTIGPLDQSISRQLYQGRSAIQDLFVDWQRGKLYWLEGQQIMRMKLGLIGGNAETIYTFEEDSIDRIAFDRKGNSFLWTTETYLQVFSLLKMRKYSASKEWVVPGFIMSAYEPYMVALFNNILTIWNRRDGARVSGVAVENGVVSLSVALREVQQEIVTKDVPPTEVTCKSPQVFCPGSTVCISRSQRCDGKRDCPDGSDEVSCLHMCAKADDFLCKDGSKCVGKDLVCDGRSHCFDGSDEDECPTMVAENSNSGPLRCRVGSKLCNDGRQCVLHDHVCDGEKDCEDGSDEQGCPNRCKADQFRCAHGRMCIDKKQVCDGTPHCQDRSDELNCFTQSHDCRHQCDNKTRCIPESFLCDGERDCVDATDEANCPKTSRGEVSVMPIYEDTPTSSPPVCQSPSVLCPGTLECISPNRLCDGRTDCPDGSDEDSCFDDCAKPDDFPCKDGSKCVGKDLVCDGRSHCTDGSDEDGCPTMASENSNSGPLRCRVGSKLCNDGRQCVLHDHVCDGEKDCEDGSDEQGCPNRCKADQFRCAHGRMCIDKKQVCDGTPQCQDRSDELNCFTQSHDCKHQCDNKTRCIPESFLCDGERDCVDATDEANCSEIKNVEKNVVTRNTDRSDVQPPPPVCKRPSMLCPGTSLCISQTRLCDGKLDCPDGSDEVSCVHACSNPGDFLCKDRRKCVDGNQVCDGRSDCFDGSDEMACYLSARTSNKVPLKCRVGSKPCNDGRQCVLHDHVCDGEKDCKDGSDERGCPNRCKADQFRCAHGRMCIDKKQVCDGTPQCQDRSDELNCFTRSHDCKHQCDNKTRCIPESFLCDGERDCVDATDEANCSEIKSVDINLVTLNKDRSDVQPPPPVCKSHSMLCPGTSLCISQTRLCDGKLDCPDGSDEVSCVHACSNPGDFLCKDSRKCVDGNQVCDGRSDCFDGSDEMACYLSARTLNKVPLKCRVGSKPCNDGRQCVLHDHVCDGEKDCKDGSDERGCPNRCKADQFRCAHGRMCIDKKQVCDGTPQCQDRSDELNCFTRSHDCRHQCDNKTRCIPESFLCDGERDCVDATDEANCSEIKGEEDKSVTPNKDTSGLQPPPPVCRSPSRLCPVTSLCITQTQICDGRIDCPDGSDEVSCIDVCSKPGHFLCKDRRKCIEGNLVCDGHSDCLDDSDELDCSIPAKTTTRPALACRVGSKPCKDGRGCVPQSHLCDGDEDCKDGSDEEDCGHQCQEGQFQCVSGGRCIKMNQVCDGTPQCLDNSDEAGCRKPSRSCSLRCDWDHHCVPEAFICNGIRDCRDGTDEDNCAASRPDQTSCESPSVLCPDMSVCVSQAQLCDGRRDCPDGSDEASCLDACAVPGDFLCEDRRKCIAEALVCDGQSHCFDGSDEVGCKTKMTPFKCRVGSKPCKNGRECVRYNHLCDGDRDCRDGSDEEDCELQCDPGMFQCIQGKKCIDFRQVCDGTPQCPDHSDEANCWKPTKTCSIRCDGNTRCIPEVFVCNGMRDCWDGADEADCAMPTPPSPCKSPYVACQGTSLCILKQYLCDGRKDCPDGSDERPCLRNCPYRSDFMCKDRTKCIDRKQVCDGRFHCIDHSDEIGCATTAPTTTTKASLRCRVGSKPCRDGRECVLHSHVCDGESDCKDGSDEIDCDFNCEAGQFQCAHGRKCIDAKLVCDGKPQCQDFSDEKDCFTRSKSCSHRCDNKTRCIPENFLCDGETDCVDGTDESDCGYPTKVVKCESPSVLCRDGLLCVPPTSLCDGKKDCPDGYDETFCFDRCPNSGDFLCKDRRKCVDKDLVCDGRSHCTDGSDEHGCPTKAAENSNSGPLKCRVGSKPCNDGRQCVLHTHVCDGEKDCDDGSDEQGCPNRCKADQFRCAHGRMCIDKKQVCDGTPQCQDRSDELNCFTRSHDCKHQCDNKTRCIPESFLCDGEKDCVDATDEANCPSIPDASNADPLKTLGCRSPSMFCKETSKCMPESQLCDGKVDCPSGADEQFCIYSCSDPDHFLCKDKRKCVHKAVVCDGYSHCADGSDEYQCPTCALQCDQKTVCLTKQQRCDGKPDCRDGSDEKDCYTGGVIASTSLPLRCPLGSKPCMDGKECVLLDHLCDGEKDCKDGSDERTCERKCKKGQFQCSHGRKCIDMKFVCDGTPQCQDRSDEANCMKLSDECRHQCDNKTRCVPETFLCDGEKDCVDGTDEANCVVEPCSGDRFQCSNGQCVALSLRCDGYADCRDHTDEKGCPQPPHCPLDHRCPHTHECLLKEWLCDGDKDCSDGSDERNCKATPLKCGEFQWSCASRTQCIAKTWRCDGMKDCQDESDESGCGQTKCPTHLFQCGSGECMDPDLVCNKASDCADGSDEGVGCLKNNCSSPGSPSCQHYCINTPHGARCGCKTGFKLHSDGLSCVDIDECKEIQPAACSHKCFNRLGSYICQCHPEFLLEPDGHSCKTADEPSLLVSEQDELLNMGLRSFSIQTLTAPGRKPIFSLDYDLRERRVYWASLEDESIKYAFHGEKDNTGTIVKGVKSDCIAIDWMGRNLYWVDGVAGQILAVRLTNSVVHPQNYVVVLDEDLKQPNSLVLLPQKGIMLWSQVGGQAQIGRSSMDGSDRRAVIRRGLNWPVSVTVDILTDRLYWTDKKLGCIGSATLDGENIRFLQLSHMPSPLSMAVFNDMIYWSDTQRRSVQGANKLTGKNRKVFLKRPGQPFALKVVHPLQQPNVPNPCQSLHCSHVCLLAPGLKAVCRCPTRAPLAADGLTCGSTLDDSSSYLMLLSLTTITQIFTKSMQSEVGLKQWPNHRSLPLLGVSEASDFDMLLQDRSITLADASVGSVSQLGLRSSGFSPIGLVLQLKGDILSALALDWVTKNLYWSSMKRPELFVTSPGGKLTAVVLQAELAGTVSIALHPPSGRMCFTAVGRRGADMLPQVDCAHMDGANRTRLWSKAKMPVSLALSEKGNTLYWADIGSDLICSVNIDGSNYKEFSTGSEFMVSFARIDNIYFWITLDNGTSQLWYSDGLQPKQMWFEVKTSVIELKAYSRSSQKGFNACSMSNGGCSHLCLPNPGGRTCRCAQDYLSVNNTKCVSSLKCPVGLKACRDRLKCIPVAKFCDQVPDCQDASDEECDRVKTKPGVKSKSGPGSLDSAVELSPSSENGVVVENVGSVSCAAEQCSAHGKCVSVNGVLACECDKGFSGDNCQNTKSSGTAIALTLMFLFGGALMVAIFLMRRRARAAREESTEKENLVTDVKEHLTFSAQNFANELYDPEEVPISSIITTPVVS